MSAVETKLSWILLVALAAGCATPEAVEDDAAAVESSSGGEDPAAESPRSDPPPPAEPPPEIALEMVIEDDAQRLSIQSRGDESARLAAIVTIERREPEGSHWISIDEVALTLPDGCGEVSDACVELAPGAELRVRLPLFEDPALEACGCAACVVPGVYRLVVQSCGGQHRRVSEPLRVE